jgi:RimJ/RimL family protein N-acetyltransferase
MTFEPFIVREAQPCDSATLLELRLRLDVETHFMMLEPGERSVSVAETEAELARIEACPNSVILVAQTEGAPEFAGYVSAEGGIYRRNRHVAYLVLGVRERHAGRGIGTALIGALQRWASGAAIHRLELTVMAHNERAIGLYRRMGFCSEGIRRHSMRVSGQFVDELMMAKLLPLE